VWHRRGGEGGWAIGRWIVRYAGAIAALGVLVLPHALGASYARVVAVQPHTCCSHSSTRLPPRNPPPCSGAASALLRGRPLQQFVEGIESTTRGKNTRDVAAN